MTDQVDEVKQKTDIVSLINDYVPLKKAGRNYKANCPFHGEKTPSFMVSPELQIYKCFGCGETGDVYSFLEKYEGIDFGEALRFLAEKAGVKLESFQGGEQDEKERLYKINSLASYFYHYVLLKHPSGRGALDYLTKERGITPETIETFQLGFSPDVAGALEGFLIGKKKINSQDIDKVGLGFFKGGRLIDKFRGRLIFPLFDHRGNVAGFAGRVLPTASTDMAKYINSPETPIYHKSNLLFGLNFVKGDIKKENEAVIVEGELDMISSWQAGFKNTLAIKGSALTEEQTRLIGRFCKKIILSLDSDFAGDMAARRGIAVAQKQGLEIRVARLSDFKDPDEAVRKNPESYKKALTDAVGVWDFIIDSVFSKHNLSEGEDMAKVSKEIIPVLASIPDKIVQAHYIEIVANRFKVPAQVVAEEIDLVGKEAEEKKVVTFLQKEEKTRQQLLEERLLTIAFQTNPEVLLTKKVGHFFVTPLPKRIYEVFEEYMKDKKEFSVSDFAHFLPQELVHGYAEMTLKDLADIIEDDERLVREFDVCITELEILSLRRQLEALSAKIREFEEKGEKAKLEDTQKKFSELSLKLSKFKLKGNGGIILQEAQ